MFLKRYAASAKPIPAAAPAPDRFLSLSRRGFLGTSGGFVMTVSLAACAPS